MSYNVLRKHKKPRVNVIKASLLCLILIASIYILTTVVSIMNEKHTKSSTSKQNIASGETHASLQEPDGSNNNNNNNIDEEERSVESKREEEQTENHLETFPSTLITTAATTSNTVEVTEKELVQVITTTTTTIKPTTNAADKIQLNKLLQNVRKYSTCIEKSINNVMEELTNNSFDELEELLRRYCFLKLFGRYSGSPCTWPPHKLVGPLEVDFTPIEFDKLRDSLLSYVELGGSWAPKHCTPRREVAIIIPFRDRESHLSVFLRQMHDIMKRQEYAYRIIVIEQVDEYPFNRGKLMNVGYKEAMNISPSFSCFVFHDVDLIPEDDRNDYGCPTSPRHLSHAVDKFDYKLPYPGIFGGVEAFLKQDFERINGFSNSYWGWGAEDDDLYRRITQNGFSLTRPSSTEGRYKMIKHVSSRDAPPNRHDKLNHAHETYQTDGISALQYKLLDVKTHPLYTLIQVDLNIEEDAIY